MVSVMHVVGSMNRGGLETLLMNVITTSSDSVRYHILCTEKSGGDYSSDLQTMGIPERYIGGNFAGLVGYGRFARQYALYGRAFRAQCVDVIHIHGSAPFDLLIAACAALRYSDARVVVHSHSSNGSHPHLNRLAARILNGLPIIKLACSSGAARWMFGSTKDVTIIPNGVPVEKFRFEPNERLKWRSRLGIDKRTFVVATVGRLVEVKNQAFLLDVVADMRRRGYRIVLLVAGEGPLRRSLESKSSGLGLEADIRVLGLVRDVPAMMAAADCFALPSLYEGLPLVAIEAQASGLPVLFSDRVSEEASIFAENVFLPIDEGAAPWSEALTAIVDGQVREARPDRSAAADVVDAAGFSVRAAAEALVGIYLREAGAVQ